MNKTFGELAVGDRFTLNGKEYAKTQDVRISCCKSINAQSTTNSNERIKLETSTTVTVNA